MQTEQNEEATEPNAGPESTDVSAHDQANLDAEAAIRAIEEQWSADPPPADDREPTEGQDVAAPSEGEIPAAEEPATEDAEKPAEEDRSIARLVEREVAVRGREDAVAAREKEWESTQQELATLREKAKSYTGDFHTDLRVKPSETLKAAGHDPDHVVRLLLAEKLASQGKPVPPELQAALRDAETDFKFRKQEERIAAYERQQEAAKWVAGIELGARTYLTQGISKDAPNFARVAKANPEWAFRAVMDEIAADAHSRGGKDLSATVLTYDDAAKRAEAKILAARKLLLVEDPPTASTTSQPTTPAPKAAAKPSSPTAPKPLVAKKQLTQKELEEQAIQAGIAEFKRAETSKKSAAR